MKTRKFTALLLVLCLLLTATPYSAPVHAAEEEHLAQEQTQTEAQTPVEDFEFAVEHKDPEQLQAELDELTYEVTRLREENVKHFHLSDGTYQAVVYGTPVHRKDAEGNWIDIDNSLSDSGAMIVTSDARVKFAKKITGNENILTLHDGNYKITFGLNNAVKKTEATYTNNESADAENKTKLQKLTDLENLSATIVYQDILEGIDLEYVLISNSIKENIIVKQTSDEYSYAFSLELNGLWAELSNNAVYLYDKNTGELSYEIPQPYMYDADGTVSTNVVYALSDTGSGKYALTIEADADWINNEDRSFPVVIDPHLRDIAQTADTYVSSGSSTTNYGSATDLWITSSTIAYYRFATPTIPNGATITNAIVDVPYYYHIENEYDLRIMAYRVMSNWNEYSINWTNKPTRSTTELGSSNLPANGALADDPGYGVLNITDYAKSWYTGTPNYGIAIKRTGGENLSVLLVAREKAQVYAKLTIYYSGSKLGDGVYAIQKQGLQTYIKSTRNSTGGVITQETTHTSAPVSSSDRDNLFKISYRPEYDDYVIRSMVDNGLVLYGNTSNLRATLTKYVVPDAEMLESYTWKLVPAGGSFYMTKVVGSTVYYLRSESTANGANLTLTTNANASGTLWFFNQYSGPLIEQIEWYNFTESIVSGNGHEYNAYMYSTRVGHNGPVSYEVVNTDYTATDKATINETYGYFKALKPGQVRVRATYLGCPWWFSRIVTIEPAGCKPYNAIVSASDPEYELINCHGYAFWSTSNLPVDRWIPGYTQLANNCSNSNQYLSMVKTRLENNWLDKELGSRYWEDVTNNGGINADLADNQWLVAMRCGFHIVDGVAIYDYHFWYRTDTGEWANKHGYNSPSEALGTDLPTTANSIGWALSGYTIINGVVYQYEYPNFYDSTIVYYRITED